MDTRDKMLDDKAVLASEIRRLVEEFLWKYEILKDVEIEVDTISRRRIAVMINPIPNNADWSV